MVLDKDMKEGGMDEVDELGVTELGTSDTKVDALSKALEDMLGEESGWSKKWLGLIEVTEEDGLILE